MFHVDSTGGVRVAVHHLAGDPGRPRLLCSHATGFHGRCYRPLAHELADRFESFALDYRGHGETPAPPGWEVEWTPFGADALAVASELALPGGLTGFGHSMGGAALLMAAHRRPALFERLVLFEPIAHPPPVQEIEMDEHPIVVGARRRRRRFATAAEAYDNFAGKPPLSLMAPAALREYVDHGLRPAADGSGAVELCCPPEIEAGIFMTARRNGVWDLLHDVDVPVLVVAGVVEEQQPSRWCREVAERLPHGTYLELAHLTHFGPFSHPGEIAGLIA